MPFLTKVEERRGGWGKGEEQPGARQTLEGARARWMGAEAKGWKK